MASVVLPLRAILLQLLLLLMVIGIEAFVLQRRLKITRRISIEYSASINLLSTAIGWLVLFGVEPLLPPALKEQLISFVLFNAWLPTASSLFILVGLATFFVTLTVEAKGFDYLETLATGKKDEPSYQKAYYRTQIQQREVSDRSRSRITTILLANACSYTVILLVLFVSSLGLGS